MLPLKRSELEHVNKKRCDRILVEVTFWTFSGSVEYDHIVCQLVRQMLFPSPIVIGPENNKPSKSLTWQIVRYNLGLLSVVAKWWGFILIVYKIGWHTWRYIYLSYCTCSLFYPGELAYWRTHWPDQDKGQWHTF